MKAGELGCTEKNSRRVIFIEILNDTSISENDDLRQSVIASGAKLDPKSFGKTDVNLPARQLITAI